MSLALELQAGWTLTSPLPGRVGKTVALPIEIEHRSSFPGRGEGSNPGDCSKGPCSKGPDSCSARTRVQVTGACPWTWGVEDAEAGWQLAGPARAGQAACPGQQLAGRRGPGVLELMESFLPGTLFLVPVVGDDLLGAGETQEEGQPPS